METRGIHHVGMAVHDLDEAVATYGRLFAGELEHRATVGDQGVEAASLRLGSGRVELLAPLDDLPTALADLAARGAELIDAEPRRGLFGLEVAFVHPDSVHGVLSEVVSH